MSDNKLHHWKREFPAQGILHLWLDKADASVNTLDSEVLGELESIVEQLEKDPPTAVLFSSAKESGFIAGADVNEFLDLTSRDQVLDKVRWVQGLFARIEKLSSITIAMIRGHCLGGGLELALACNYRIAERSPQTSIGLPEVKLGIHPAYGGVVRLSRLIDPVQALNLMLAGRSLDASAARRAGIVDVATQQRHMMTAAMRIARGQKPSRKRSINARLMGSKWLRGLVAKWARKEVAKKVNLAHYPAPDKLIDLWRDLPGKDDDAFTAEAESLAGLFEDPTASRTIRNLVRLFLLDRELKSRAKSTPFEGQRVHVVGAGAMGGDIAAWCVLRGLTVTLEDARAELIAPAISRAYDLFKRRLRQTYRITTTMDRLIPDPHGYGIDDADLVIEAITEKLDAKRGLYANLEPRMKEGALLATNTSSLPLEDLSSHLARPERLVGIHFFNPVAMMQLVEVVRGENASDESVQRALGFVTRIGKLPIEVKSSPGFLVNRVLMSYLTESLRMLEEDIPAPLIDKVSEDLGFPMGPIELADTVGLDICQAVAQEMIPTLGGEESERLKQKVANGHTGKKTGRGFYRWSNGKPQKGKAAAGDYDTELMRDRMLYAILNESVQCLAENVVADADALDAGMVYGTGFPPFLGGPMNHLRELGKASCEQRLNELADQVGERFRPRPGWQSLDLD